MNERLPVILGWAGLLRKVTPRALVSREGWLCTELRELAQRDMRELAQRDMRERTASQIVLY